MIHYGSIGIGLLIAGLLSAIATVAAYVVTLKKPGAAASLKLGRVAYAATALSVLGVFAILGGLVYFHVYRYEYVWEHTSNDLHGWFRFAATWSGQEGSFLLWAAWTSLIGFVVLSKAGKYEARVMPIFVTVLGLLCAILLKQSPFHIVPSATPDQIALNPAFANGPLDGQGLNPSLVNYWMTIHPPTIFFGFASLLVPYCYAVAALIWKDYDDWTERVMPYSLLSCAVLGVGLMMGGYWAYETQGWHGFWAWDPVENASFFPWLAVTALVHGLVVQQSRGGMARTNTFLGFLAFWLFLVGTFLTRSGALASKGSDGQLLSVHAFDDIGKSALWLMATMVIVYGGGALALWLWRLRSMPSRQALGDTLLSRDFAFFLAVLLMLVACAAITMGTTRPLLLSWMHRAPDAPKAVYYNRIMLPLACMAALVLGAAPWLAWRKTDPDTFLRKLVVPWLTATAAGFLLLLWVLNAERLQAASMAADPVGAADTLRAWVSPKLETVAVVGLATLAMFAALSNSMLAYRVLRAKPLNAGGWLAHVGIGLVMIGVIITNTFERTERFVLEEGGPPKQVFGYRFQFEKMTGSDIPGRPFHPDYDQSNAVQIRVTPPGADGSTDGGPRTFLVSPRWFAYNMNTAPEDQFERIRWPAIRKSFGHDLYVSFADDPQYEWPTDDPNRERAGIQMRPGEKRMLGDDEVWYYKPIVIPQQLFEAVLAIRPPEGQGAVATPAIRMDNGQMLAINAAVPGITDADGVPAAIYLDRLEPGTHVATLRVSLPGYRGRWAIPLEVTFKPWINLVWTGVLVTTLGALLAMMRRITEARIPAAGRRPRTYKSSRR